MKRIYVKPVLDVQDLKESITLLAGTAQSDWGDAKEQTFVEEEESLIGDVQGPNLWDEENEDE